MKRRKQEYEKLMIVLPLILVAIVCSFISEIK